MRLLPGFVALLASLCACEAASPPRGLEATCAKACEVQASACSSHQCARGCNLVIDRLAENQGDHVLACIASTKDACDDRAWARCATLVGPHSDGGPPPPGPPPDALQEEDEE